MGPKINLKSEFVKNVATVMTGTAFSQVVALAVTPILTRNYIPEDFGFLLIYISILSIIGTMSTGKFEQAILLVSEKDALKKLVYISFSISVGVSLVLGAVLFFGKKLLIRYLELDVTLYSWLYTLTGLIIIYSFYTVFSVILNLQKRFKRLTVAKMIKSITSVIISLVCIFFLKDARGLILGEFMGYLFATIFVIAVNKEMFIFKKETRKGSLQIAKRYKNFPLFNIPSEFMNMASAQMPVFFLTTYFGPTITGFYSLMKRVLDAPINLFSKSILEVFRQKAAEQYVIQGECKKLFKSTAKHLFLIAIIPFTTLFFLAPQLFSFVFGEEWYIAGEYAKIFAVFYFFKFVSSPLSYMFYIAEKQKIDFLLHLYIFFSSIIILNLPIAIDINDEKMLWIYCINFIFIYLLYFFISLKLASGKNDFDKTKFV
ncbi:oligosaccharide flippase family protein [Muricauda brasiliensis]|uniref:oligosaccharide flippase family protein n=1 Tax=Muricauda brasiliensis TaxID=2162892 RepID=UPI000D3D35EA|nr:oligosaccharide flippase family protein [Muricauda brasiliensis]